MIMSVICGGDGSWGGRSVVAVMSSRIAGREQEVSFSMLDPAVALISPSATAGRIDEWDSGEECVRSDQVTA